MNRTGVIAPRSNVLGRAKARFRTAPGNPLPSVRTVPVRKQTLVDGRLWPTAGTHHRRLTGSLIAARMLTMATLKSHHLQQAVGPSCSEAAARECQRPARSIGDRAGSLSAELSVDWNSRLEGDANDLLDRNRRASEFGLDLRRGREGRGLSRGEAKSTWSNSSRRAGRRQARRCPHDRARVDRRA